MQRALPLALVFLLLAACALVSPKQEYPVVTHPDGALYVGDQVSFEILAPDAESRGEIIEVSFDGLKLGSTTFEPFGIGQRDQATFWWIWDTSGLEPGKYAVTFSLESGHSWVENFTLRPASQVPPPEPGAAWVSSTSACCTIYYISGTSAERDIEALSALANEQSNLVASQLSVALQERIPVTFMPRVIGHGGFAWDGVYISYLDGNYVGNEMDLVLHHEFVHYYDEWIGSEYMPSVLQEGLAVYLSGGHFKPEPIGARAGALLDLGWYIPLTDLADEFYDQQHDAGYLEAAALVQFIYETMGPGAFIEFYRTIPFPNGQSDSDVLDEALRDQFNISLSDLEIVFKNYLTQQPVTDDIRTDLELTIATFDTVRQYQSVFDTSAYFLTAWLPDGQVMREKGIVADLTRHPRTWQNWLIEKLLVRVHDELFSGEYQAAENSLEWTTWLLEVLEP